MLKDEPEDLTHLAPTAGDACIPLEETTPFFSDMFDEFIMPDSYSSLLPDDISSLDSSSQEEDQKCVSVVPTLCDESRLMHHHPESPVSSSTPSPSSSNSSNSHKCVTGSSLSDPYINYRDELSETSNSPHLLSPSGVEKVTHIPNYFNHLLSSELIRLFTRLFLTTRAYHLLIT